MSLSELKRFPGQLYGVVVEARRNYRHHCQMEEYYHSTVDADLNSDSDNGYGNELYEASSY